MNDILNMNKSFPIFIICLLFLVLMSGCAKKQVATPKPKGYFRIEMPRHNYRPFDTSALPFTFSYADIAQCEFHNQDTVQWLLVKYPRQKARIELSYQRILGNAEALILQDKQFVEMHFVKADNVENSDIFDSVSNMYGIFTDIEGRDVACPLHFWVSDMKRNYVRGTLYFEFAPNNDSVQPVIDYIREDALKMIETFEWK